MSDYLKTYRIKLTTLGPLYIGSGRSVGKKEYIYDRIAKKVYIPDQQKMYGWLIQNGYQAQFMEFMLQEKVPKEGFTAWLRQNRIDARVWKEWIAYTLDSSDAVDNDHAKIEIQACMKDAYGMVYVPGSSLKGAIRTALMGSALYRNRGKLQLEAKKVIDAPFSGRTNYLSREERSLSERVFHTAGRKENRKDMVNDCMAGIRISDSGPLDTDCLILCRKKDELPNGNGKSLNVLRECIRPQTEIVFDLTIDSTLYKGDAETILRAIFQFGKCYTECFGSKFRSGDVLGKGMLYLGGGCGYASKTVTYPLFGGNGVKTVSRIIDATLPYKIKGQHKHYKDVELGVSPHTIKKTTYKGKKYSFGLCQLEIEPFLAAPHDIRL